MNDSELIKAEIAYRTRHRRCCYCDFFYWPDGADVGVCMVKDKMLFPLRRPFFCKAYKIGEDK